MGRGGQRVLKLLPKSNRLKLSLQDMSYSKKYNMHIYKSKKIKFINTLKIANNNW